MWLVLLPLEVQLELPLEVRLKLPQEVTLEIPLGLQFDLLLEDPLELPLQFCLDYEKQDLHPLALLQVIGFVVEEEGVVSHLGDFHSQRVG